MKSRKILVLTLVLVLVGLNAYQYFAPQPSTPQPKMSDEQVKVRFQLMWSKSRTLFENKWFGIETLQHPFDVWITQEIIFEVKPDFIVETGTYRGGSASLWAIILEHANPGGRVITVDIRDLRDSAAMNLPIWQRRIDFLVGSSTSPEIVSEVAKRVEGKKVLVILDSNHSKNHVLNELRAYAPLVNVGSYVIVQDTMLGPSEAIEAFMATTDQFVIDSSRERLLLTNNLNGFLKRVK